MLLEGDNIQIPIGIYDNFSQFFFPWQASLFSGDYSSSLLKKLGIKTLLLLLVIVVVLKLKKNLALSLSTQTVMTNIKFTLD